MIKLKINAQSVEKSNIASQISFGKENFNLSEKQTIKLPSGKQITGFKAAGGNAYIRVKEKANGEYGFKVFVDESFSKKNNGFRLGFDGLKFERKDRDDVKLWTPQGRGEVRVSKYVESKLDYEKTIGAKRLEDIDYLYSKYFGSNPPSDDSDDSDDENVPIIRRSLTLNGDIETRDPSEKVRD